MSQTEWYPTAGIEGVSANFDPDGSLRESGSIEIQVNFNETKDFLYDPEKVREDGHNPDEDPHEEGDVVDSEYRNGAYARLRFDVEDGVAEFRQFKDVSTGTSRSNWTGIEFLKTLWAAHEVVQELPQVADVRDPMDVVQDHLEDGREAEIYRA